MTGHFLANQNLISNYLVTRMDGGVRGWNQQNTNKHTPRHVLGVLIDPQVSENIARVCVCVCVCVCTHVSIIRRVVPMH